MLPPQFVKRKGLPEMTLTPFTRPDDMACYLSYLQCAIRVTFRSGRKKFLVESLIISISDHEVPRTADGLKRLIDFKVDVGMLEMRRQKELMDKGFIPRYFYFHRDGLQQKRMRVIDNAVWFSEKEFGNDPR